MVNIDITYLLVEYSTQYERLTRKKGIIEIDCLFNIIRKDQSSCASPLPVNHIPICKKKCQAMCIKPVLRL